MIAVDQNPKIIVSYRRSDSAMAGRIFDRLVQRFGKTSLFIDIDNIPFGGDFRKHIDDALKSSDLLIAIVGPKWLGSRDGGDVRIMQEADPVRVEIETALRRDISILPVLLEGSQMPEPSQLPEGIKDFAYRNAVEVESGRDFNVHIDRLIGAIEKILGNKVSGPATPLSQASTLVSPPPPKTDARRRSPLILGLIGLLAVAALGAALWLGRDWLQTVTTNDSPTGANYCDDLKRVVAEASINFVSILGKQSSGVWTARIQLAGWDNCIVQDWIYEGKTTRYFSCQFPPFPTIDALHAKRDEVDAYLRPCLGPDWVRRRSQFSDQTTDVTFEMGQNDPIVRLRESYYKDTQEWFLRLDVDAPQIAAATPAN